MATLTIKGKYDGRGVKAAKKDLTSFEKFSAASISRMKLGAAVAVAAGIAFAKQSIDAALAESKAQAILATQMRNSGFGSASAAADEFVSKLQLATNVTEEQLRPAMALAIRTTKDFTASQQLLSLAADISTGASKDFGSVMDALTKGLNGNRKGLLTLGSGMSKSYLLTAKMSDIIAQLTRRFNGDAAKAVDSLGGKFENFKLVVGEAQETVGKGLVDALAILASRGGTSISGLNAKITDTAQTLSDILVGLAAYNAEGQKTASNSWWGNALSNTKIGQLLKWGNVGAQVLAKKGRDVAKIAEGAALENSRESKRSTNGNQMSGLKYVALMNTANKKAAADALAALKAKEAAAAAAAAKKLAAQNKLNAAKAKELQLAKLAAKYDLELIGLAAAIRNNQGNAGVLGRLSDLTTIATANAGLPVSASALAGAKNTQVPNVYVTVQGSVITQQELTESIRRQLANVQAQNGYGLWGGGL